MKETERCAKRLKEEERRFNEERKQFTDYVLKMAKGGKQVEKCVVFYIYSYQVYKLNITSSGMLSSF